ncbi:MAG: hypothetical protein FWH32_05355 [Clostridiales bacterium]|nr:hypothetical protein [Clostridiales bacterium]
MGKAEKFLIENGLHESCYDFEAYADGFAADMEAGLSGRDSSLMMLPSYLGVTPKAPPDGSAIAIDAGGTNLRVALVGFAPGAAPAVSKYEKRRIPGTDGIVSCERFFDLIVEYIGDMTETSNEVGFCFSFPSEIGADRDGKIVGFNKEVKVRGSEGASIGGELNAALARAGKDPVKVTVLNDTVAALVGAVFAGGLYGMGGYIGLIYGTGINICYYDAEKGMLINTEAGCYDGFRQSGCDTEIDAESDRPRDHMFEKMVSGAYFSTIALKAACLAATEGLFGAGTCKAVAGLSSLDAVSVDEFMRADGNARLGTGLGQLCVTEEDAETLHEIFDGLYERAAKLVAIAMTAVLRKSGATEGSPALIVAEGSAFIKGYKFRERFERWIASYVCDGAYELVLADDDVVIGAAASVFL